MCLCGLCRLLCTTAEGPRKFLISQNRFSKSLLLLLRRGGESRTDWRTVNNNGGTEEELSLVVGTGGHDRPSRREGRKEGRGKCASFFPKCSSTGWVVVLCTVRITNTAHFNFLLYYN